MRIVIWNCRWKYWDGRKHREIISEYKPDILGISECNPKEKFTPEISKDCISWVGQSGQKRIKGVAAFLLNHDLDCKPAEDKYFVQSNPIKYSIPLRVSSGSLKFNLIIYRNCGLVEGRWQWEFYSDLIKECPTIIIGDFNCPSTYEDVKNLNESMNNYRLESVYHKLKHEEYGQESSPTFYPNNKKGNLFIDYCFASKDLEGKLDLKIGKKEKWIGEKFSDHCPLILDMDL